MNLITNPFISIAAIELLSMRRSAVTKLTSHTFPLNCNQIKIMGKGRLEAFSDGVLAIIITIMVLELKIPHGNTPDDLKPLLPVFMSYVLSFIYIGIYWTIIII
jgi:hypothetical protein